MQTTAPVAPPAFSAAAGPEEALALFDRLPAVEPKEMLGRWLGGSFATGHPLDGVLETFHWYGKAFRGPDDVDPLLFRTAGGAVVPLRATLQPAVDLLRPKASRRGVTVELDVEANATAHADPDALCQVVASLVDATITHCPDGTRVSITSHPEDDERVQVRIEDDGRGETAEALMREDPSLNDRVPAADEGMMFGLAVCKSLVEGMGGALSFESRPGEGTSFRFSLPAPRA